MVLTERTWRHHLLRESRLQNGQSLSQFRKTIISNSQPSSQVTRIRQDRGEERVQESADLEPNDFESDGAYESELRDITANNFQLQRDRLPEVQPQQSNQGEQLLIDAMLGDEGGKEEDFGNEVQGLMQEGLVEEREIELGEGLEDEPAGDDNNMNKQDLSEQEGIGDEDTNEPIRQIRRASNTSDAQVPGHVENRELLYGVAGYQYKRPEGRLPWTDDEILSFLLFEIKRDHNVPRAAHQAYMEFFKSHIRDHSKPLLIPTTLKRLVEVTGIQHTQFDCCINSCMAFTGHSYAQLTHCLYCQEARHFSGNNPRARKTVDYIPFIHRLRQQYANPIYAETMQKYMEFLKPLGGDKRRDIWDGSLIQDLKTQKGLFKEITNIAMGFSTDGVRVFQTRTLFAVWPLILINYNLPPEERTKKKNIILLGECTYSSAVEVYVYILT